MAHGAEKTDSVTNPRITWEGCSVLLDINDGDRLVFARLTPSATLKIGNKKCSLGSLIGCPFGSTFQVESGPKGPYLSRVSIAHADCHVHEQNDFQLKDEDRDNRALIDNNTAQSLSGEHIDAMQREGATGDQIVEALIANSSTFQNKTSFSQEKYRIRKQKKYAPRILLRRPFSRSVCEAYFRKYPARIGFLRVDTLSLLLSMAHVCAYSDVLVVDMVGGILTGAVAERLGGTGSVCNTYFGSKPYAVDIVGIFNFNSEICSRILRCSLSDLCFTQNRSTKIPISNGSVSVSEARIVEEGNSPQDSFQHPASTRGTSFSSPDKPGHMDTCPSSTGVSSGADESNDATVPKPLKSAKLGRQASAEDIKLWKENGFTSMIVAAPGLDTWNLVRELLPFLSFSAPFAIYHQYLQPLATCMHKLQAEKMAIGLQISEPWLREYQVLPSRTHPFMQLSAFGGYILSGFWICSDEAVQENKQEDEKSSLGRTKAGGCS